MIVSDEARVAVLIICVTVTLVTVLLYAQLRIRHKMAKNALRRVRAERNDLRREKWL